MNSPTPNQSRDIEVHALFPTLNTMKELQSTYSMGSWRETFATTSRRKAQVCSLPKRRGVTEFSQQNWVYPNPYWSKKNPNLNVILKGCPKKFLGLFG